MAGALTLGTTRIRQGQPKRKYDGEQYQVGQLLLDAVARERHVQGLGLNLVGDDVNGAAGFGRRV